LVRRRAHHRLDGRRRQGVARSHPRRDRRGGPRRRPHLARPTPLGHRLLGQGTPAGETLVMALQSIQMSARMSAFLPRVVTRALAGAALLACVVAPASATKIDRVMSPGGIEIWLVHEPTVPLIAMDFA